MAPDLTTAKPNYFGNTGDIVTRMYTDTYHDNTPMTDAYCGGLYNKDSIGYYRLPVVGRRVSELKEATHDRLVKLYTDIIALNTYGTIILDTQVDITATLSIPETIKFIVEPGGGFNVMGSTILTINSEIDTKSQRLVYGSGTVYFLGNHEVWADAFGATPVYTPIDDAIHDLSIIDQQPYLQKCISSCINTRAIMRTKAGIFYIKSPLLIMRYFNIFTSTYTGDTYISFTWHGTGSTTDTYYRSTRIVALYKDTFGIGIQNGRNIHLTNIQVTGSNPVTAQPTSETRYEDMVFVDPGVRDTRYSPYAGIVIDPFFTTTNTANDPYPGFDAYYTSGSAATAGTKFEFVIVEDFAVGFLISPSGNVSHQLGSEITWMDCRVDGAKSGIASCDAQNRNLYWYAGSVTSCKYCFDSYSYGAQLGNIPRIYGVNINGKYIFLSKGQSGEQAIHVTGMHAESIGGIGWIGIGDVNTNNTAKIEDSRINFGDHRGSVDLQVSCFANLELVGCVLESECFRAYVHFAATLTLRNCKIKGLNGEPVISSNNAFNTLIDNCFYNDTKFNEAGNLVSDRTTQMSRFLTPSALNLTTSTDRFNRIHLVNGQFIVSNGQNKILTVSSPDFVWPLMSDTTPYNTSYQITQINIGSDGITRAVIQLDSNWVEKIKLYTQIMCRSTSIKYENFTGARLLSSNKNIMGCIESFDPVTLKATLRNVPDAFVEAVEAAVGAGQPLPSCRLSIVSWRRYHAPTVTTNANTIAANTITVNNVGAWAKGDRIRSKAGEIPDGTLVTDINGNTLTLSKAVIIAEGVSVYDAEVQEYTPMLQSAALNAANNPATVTQGTSAPGASYSQSEAAAVQTQLVTLTNQYNALLARFSDLVAKDQAAKIRA